MHTASLVEESVPQSAAGAKQRLQKRPWNEEGEGRCAKSSSLKSKKNEGNWYDAVFANLLFGRIAAMNELLSSVQQHEETALEARSV